MFFETKNTARLHYLSRIVPGVFFLFWTLMGCSQYAPDLSYGQQGKVRLHFDSYNEAIDLLSEDDDATIVLCNTSFVTDSSFNTDVVLCRLLPNGETDSAFATSGVLQFDFPGMDISTGRQLIKTTSGTLFLLGSGYSLNNPSFHPFWLARMLEGGKIDSTFGNNGFAFFQFAGFNETPNCIKPDAMNRLLLAGASTDTSDIHSEVPVLARIDTNGILDSTFGESGKVYLRFPFGIIQDRSERHMIGGVINDFLILDDERILVAGGYSNSNNIVSFFAMLTADGQLDSTFFSDGYLGLDLTPFASNYAIRLIQHNQQILFCSKSDAIVSRDFYYGYIDLNLNTYGTDAIDFNQSEDEPKDMLITQDGRVLLAGYSLLPQNNTGSYFSDFFSLAGITGSGYPYGSYHQTFSFQEGTQNGINTLQEQTNGKILCAGFVNKPSGSDVALLRLAETATPVGDLKNSTNDFSFFPNPANQFVVISQTISADVQLLDVNGSIIKTFSTGQHTVIDLSGVASGLYFLKTGTVVKKLCVVK